MKKVRLLLALLLALLIQIPPAQLQAVPPDLFLPRGFVQETVATGLALPTAFALGPGGRIYVAEKAGLVRVIQNGEVLSTPFIDISSQINTVKDRGLTGIALHPRFPTVPYVYLAYSYEPPEAAGHAAEGARVSRVSRVSAGPNPNLALPGSEVVLVGRNSVFANIGDPNRMNRRPYTCTNADGSYVADCLPNEGNSHTVSQLGFGPDGALYISSGDGINYDYANLRAQSLDSLAGKILRVNPVDGSGYASNPFYDGNPQSNRSKIFALGLRNPWRFAFQPGSGSLFVADVGKDRWEEINRVPPGANLGWPCFEGPRENAFDPECEPTLSGEWPVTHAIFAYPHDDARGAAIGGDFVRGANFPAIYRGTYFYSDFNSATIDYLTFGADGSVTSTVFAAPAYAAAQLTFGADGYLYVLYVLNGALGRIRYTGAANSAPQAVLGASATSGNPPLEVRFTAGNSRDPDGDPMRFAWSFGDGQTSSELDPVHIYTEPGRYTASLTVTDLNGSDTKSTVITVGEGAPEVTILSPRSGTRYAIGNRVDFRGRAVDAEDGELPAASLRWEAFLHHNAHTHFDFFSGVGSSGSFTYEDHDDNSFIQLCLSATDSSGLEGRSCVDLKPIQVELTFRSLPSGLSIGYNGSSYQTPFRIQTYLNARRTVSAPPTVAGGLTFQNWSDGGEARHVIRVGGNETFAAVYAADDGSIPMQANADATEPVRLANQAPAPASLPSAPVTVIASPAQVAPASAVAVVASAPAVTSSGPELGQISTEGAPEGGARILVRPSARFEGSWSAVQWKDDKGIWQTVEGWQGAIENGYKRWWISPDLYGAGPFRWVLLNQKEGSQIAVSQPFHLPEAHDQMLVWEVP